MTLAILIRGITLFGGITPAPDTDIVAEDDIIYVDGISPAELSEAVKKELEDTGWTHDGVCWQHYT